MGNPSSVLGEFPTLLQNRFFPLDEMEPTIRGKVGQSTPPQQFRKFKLLQSSPNSNDYYSRPRGSRGGSLAKKFQCHFTKCEKIYFANITSGSEKAAEQLNSLASECALLCLAEVHDLLDKRRHFYSKLRTYQHVVGPAEPSEDSLNGTYGGTSVSASHHIQWSPLSCSQFDSSNKVWRHAKCNAYCSAMSVKFHNIGGC